MLIQAGDLGIELDFGRDQPGDVLQRRENGKWLDYLADGQAVTNPVNLKSLPPGKYRFRER